MTDRSFLDWPFFEPAHRELAASLDAWAKKNLADIDEADVDAACRELVRRLAAGGWLDHCVPAAYGGKSEKLDVRSLCLIRETLARHSGLADFAWRCRRRAKESAVPSFSEPNHLSKGMKGLP